MIEREAVSEASIRILNQVTHVTEAFVAEAVVNWFYVRHVENIRFIWVQW